MQKPPKTPHVRRIQPEENKLVMAIVADFPASAGFSWTPDKLKAELVEAEAWGVWDADGLGAFVIFRENAEAFEISALGTSRKKQRTGLMKTLMSALIDANGHKGWWLEVHEENQAALRLYAALGFVSNSWRRNYYPDGKAAILMSRNKKFSAPSKA